MNYQLYLADAAMKSLQRRHRGSTQRVLDEHLQEARRIRNHIVEANLRLLVAIAKKYADSLTPFDDLLSEGHLPLMRAVELFDVSRGFRFSTYATHSIRNHFNRWISNAQKHQRRFTTTEQFVFDELPGQNFKSGWRAEAAAGLPSRRVELTEDT